MTPKKPYHWTELTVQTTEKKNHHTFSTDVPLFFQHFAFSFKDFFNREPPFPLTDPPFFQRGGSVALAAATCVWGAGAAPVLPPDQPHRVPFSPSFFIYGVVVSAVVWRGVAWRRV
jgi:hypothetical protein